MSLVYGDGLLFFGYLVPKIVQIGGREIASKRIEKNPRLLTFSERGQKERQL